MRQTTLPNQTAKMIELGFDKPKCEVKAEQAGDYAWYNSAYSIGELIEMLPSRYNGEDLEINRDWKFERWVVFYCGDDATAATELVDALYDMCIKLKEEGQYGENHDNRWRTIIRSARR